MYVDLIIWVTSYALYKGKNYLRLEIMNKGITHIVFFCSSLSRVLEPSVLMEMKLSDGKIHTFEVRHGLGEINMSVGGKAVSFLVLFKIYQSYKPGFESTPYLSAYQSLGTDAK